MYNPNTAVSKCKDTDLTYSLCHDIYKTLLKVLTFYPQILVVRMKLFNETWFVLFLVSRHFLDAPNYRKSKQTVQSLERRKKQLNSMSHSGIREKDANQIYDLLLVQRHNDAKIYNMTDIYSRSRV